MNRKNMYTGLALGALLMFLGGCTAGFQSVPINELEPGPEIPYSTVRVDVKPALAEDVTDELTDLEMELIEGLKKLDGVEKVYLEHADAPTDDSLLIKVEVSNIRKVSGASRFFLGSFAGKAKMTTIVDFVDGSDGTLLGKYKLVGSSGGSGLSGGTEDAVTQTAKAIVEVLAETYSIDMPDMKRTKKLEEGEEDMGL